MNIRECLREGIDTRLANRHFKGGLGAVTDFVGLTDYKGAEASQAAATAAIAQGSKDALQISRENIAFQREQMTYQKEQYADWEAVYGDLQKNLGDYYNSVSGSSVASKQLSAQASAYAQADKELTQSLAQRGISGSGVEAAARTTMAMQKANQTAQIRATADEQAAQQKAGFLSLGMGQGTQLLGIQTQQAGNVGSAFNTAASNVLQGGISQGQIGSAFAQGTQSGSFAMGQSLIPKVNINASDFRFKNNIVLIKTIDGINIYSWEWNDFAKSYIEELSEAYGVIAQELETLYPSLVYTDSKGYKSVDYTGLKQIIGEF
jgi:hypothetical protein